MIRRVYILCNSSAPSSPRNSVSCILCSRAHSHLSILLRSASLLTQTCLGRLQGFRLGTRRGSTSHWSCFRSFHDVGSFHHRFSRYSPASQTVSSSLLSMFELELTLHLRLPRFHPDQANTSTPGSTFEKSTLESSRASIGEGTERGVGRGSSQCMPSKPSSGEFVPAPYPGRTSWIQTDHFFLIKVHGRSPWSLRSCESSLQPVRSDATN